MNMMTVDDHKEYIECLKDLASLKESRGDCPMDSAPALQGAPYFGICNLKDYISKYEQYLQTISQRKKS